MSAFVDNLADRGWVLYGRRVESCHLIADSLDELHQVAKAAGCRRGWFQEGSFPHYDLTHSRRERAIRAGAIPLERRDFVAELRRIREDMRRG